MSTNCCRIDIIFDLYYEVSRKRYERNRRIKFYPISMQIRRGDQPRPIDMDKFWSSPEIKMHFQQFFIKWIIQTYDRKPLHLGGAHEFDQKSCIKVSEGCSQDIRLLKCSHEEADDRIIYHVNLVLINFPVLLLLPLIQMFWYVCCTILLIGVTIFWMSYGLYADKVIQELYQFIS